MSSGRLADRIKTIALSSGAELVGVASAEHLEEESPKGHRRAHELISAKGCGMKVLDVGMHATFFWHLIFAIQFIIVSKI